MSKSCDVQPLQPALCLATHGWIQAPIFNTKLPTLSSLWALNKNWCHLWTHFCSLGLPGSKLQSALKRSTMEDLSICGTSRNRWRFVLGVRPFFPTLINSKCGGLPGESHETGIPGPCGLILSSSTIQMVGFKTMGLILPTAKSTIFSCLKVRFKISKYLNYSVQSIQLIWWNFFRIDISNLHNHRLCEFCGCLDRTVRCRIQRHPPASRIREEMMSPLPWRPSDHLADEMLGFWSSDLFGRASLAVLRFEKTIIGISYQNQIWQMGWYGA